MSKRGGKATDEKSKKGKNSNTKNKTKKYSIVGNVTNNEVIISVVSSNWIDNIKNVFYYPPKDEKNAHRFLEDCAEPNYDTWEFYDIYKIYEKSIGIV